MNLSLFETTLKLHSKINLPALTWLERKVYKEILTAFNHGRRLEIFEYGTGFSTLYFAKFLKRKNIDFHFYSVDNNYEWHKKVTHTIKKNNLENNVTLFICEFPPFWEKAGWDWEKSPEPGQFAPIAASESEYILKPKSLNKKFDLIVIDARFRRRCLEVAPECLNEEGIVFLHDAQKKQYHDPLSRFEYSAFIDSGPYFPFERRKYQCWIGSLENPLVDRIAKKYKK